MLQCLDLTRAFKAIASEARLAPALVGSRSVQTDSMVAALVGVTYTLIEVWNMKKPVCTFRRGIYHKCFPVMELVYLTYTIIFSVYVFQVVAILALAVVAAECVHALSVERAEVLPGNTLINI